MRCEFCGEVIDDVGDFVALNRWAVSVAEGVNFYGCGPVRKGRS